MLLLRLKYDLSVIHHRCKNVQSDGKPRQLSSQSLLSGAASRDPIQDGAFFAQEGGGSGPRHWTHNATDPLPHPRVKSIILARMWDHAIICAWVFYTESFPATQLPKLTKLLCVHGAPTNFKVRQCLTMFPLLKI